MTLWTVACQAPLPRGSPEKNTGVGSHSLLQGIFLTQGSNPGFPHCRQILYCLSHQGNPYLAKLLFKSDGEIRTFSDKPMEKTHSSTLAWQIPWMEDPGGLQSMGLQRVGHDWATSLSLFTFMHWRRKWQPTPVFLPGESQGREAWWAAIYGSHRVGHDWSDLAAAAAAAGSTLLAGFLP